MTIRYALRKDYKQLVALCKQHAIYEKSTYSTTGKEKLLVHHLFEDLGTVRCLVAEENDKLIGYATFMKQFSTWDAGYYVYLDCLFFNETARGNGLGKKMMEHVKIFAVQENCEQIQWQTPNFNKKAISFYRKLGAVSKSKERFFWQVEI